MTREMLDERLDNLLDDALRLPEAPPGLSDRVLGATAEAFAAHRRRKPSAAGGRRVLARIGPGLLSLAATMALAAGAALWIASMRAQVPVEPVPGGGSIASVDPQATPVDAAWNASIDDAITLLALQVEMVDLRWDETWAEPHEGVEDAVLRWELEAMSGEEMVF